MKLKLEDLKVESFETESNRKNMKGTVKGYKTEGYENTDICVHTLDPSCPDDCGFVSKVSCNDTCLENCTERCTI